MDRPLTIEPFGNTYSRRLILGLGVCPHRFICIYPERCLPMKCLSRAWAWRIADMKIENMHSLETQYRVLSMGRQTGDLRVINSHDSLTVKNSSSP